MNSILQLLKIKKNDYDNCTAEEKSVIKEIDNNNNHYLLGWATVNFLTMSVSFYFLNSLKMPDMSFILSAFGSTGIIAVFTWFIFDHFCEKKEKQIQIKKSVAEEKLSNSMNFLFQKENMQNFLQYLNTQTGREDLNIEIAVAQQLSIDFLQAYESGCIEKKRNALNQFYTLLEQQSEVEQKNLQFEAVKEFLKPLSTTGVIEHKTLVYQK